MRLTLCARFAIFLAVLLANTEALTMTDDKAQAKTEAPDNTATTQTALTVPAEGYKERKETGLPA